MMEVDSSIFRAYDIRGIYGKNLGERVMERIGMALGTMMNKRKMGNKVLVGNDIRQSSESLSKAFIKGVTSMGINVTDVGTTSFGVAIFSGWKKNKDVTAFITASHNPPEWNGIKFFDKDCIGFFKEDNEELLKIIEGDYFEDVKPVEERGKLDRTSMKKDYINEVKNSFEFDSKVKVVVDCGNGSTATVLPELFSSIENIDSTIIFNDIDPSFPERGSDVEEKNLEKLSKYVIDKGADMGIGFDGDGDRVGVVDDKGNYVKSEKVMSILCGDLLENRTGPVVVNVEASMIIENSLKPKGASIFRIPVGHTFMGQSVNENSAIFGGEPSCHYIIPSYFPFDDAVIPALKLVEILSKNGRKLSEISESIPAYPKDRTGAECDDKIKFKVIDNLKERYAQEFEDINTLDGIRIGFNDGWVLIRASNTSPIIRVTTEAETEEKLGELKEKFLTELKLEIDKVKTME